MLIDKIKSYIERALSHKNMFLNMLGSSIPNVNSNTYENSIKGNWIHYKEPNTARR